MVEPTLIPARGVAKSVRWGAVCKDCQRKGEVSAGFAYPDVWIEGVAERGGSRSDRCPICRQRHARDARSFAAPYVDVDTVGRVADPRAPTGPLGGLGPLPLEHLRSEATSDLGKYDFGLDDAAVLTLLEGLATKQVALVVAGTGTGKSTFLPYRLLVPPDGARLHLAERGAIVITEPRRLAATETAKFVAERLHLSNVGAGSDIGYRVQGEPAFDASCRLLYVTDGSLINWLRDGSFKRFSAIMVDEAHERSKNIDIILGLLREMLPRHPHLKLIIASATIDPEFFIEYFGGKEKVFPLNAPAKKLFGYGEPLWPLKEIDFAHPDWKEPGPNGEDLRAITKKLAELRIVTEPIEPGERNAVWREQMPKLVAEQVLAILHGVDFGDILAFLPGETSINEAIKLIEEGKPDNVDVYPLLRTTPPKIQAKAQGEKSDPSRRRVVVSTNIAETSLTIDGITYVVDSGLINQSQWDVVTATKRIPALPHSQTGVRQRWGRVGRKAPGWVFPLYTEEQFSRILPPNTPPESTRDDLEQFVLTALAAGVDTPGNYVWPSSFRRSDKEESGRDAAYRATFQQELGRASAALRLRGAVDAEGDLTPVGRELQAFPGSMAHATALALADRMTCAVEVATALLLLSSRKLVGHLFRFDRQWDATRRNQARRIHEAMRVGCLDDLELALKTYAIWEAEPRDRREVWASEHLVNHQELTRVDQLRRELLDPLMPGLKSDKLRPVQLELVPRARRVLTRTLADQAYCRKGANEWIPERGSSDRQQWQLDQFAHVTGAERIIAFQRTGGTNGIVYLANAVEFCEPAEEQGEGWLALALAAIRRTDDGSDRRLGLTLMDHLAYAEEWRIGERYLCDVFPSDGGPRLRAVQRLGGLIRLAEVSEQDSPQDEESGEEELDDEPSNKIGDGLASVVEDVGVVSITATAPATRGPESDEETVDEGLPDAPDGIEETTWVDVVETGFNLEVNDLVALAPVGVLDPTQEAMFVDVRELEAPDNEGSPILPTVASAAQVREETRLASARLPASTPLARGYDGAPLLLGHARVCVLGYEGCGNGRKLIVESYIGDGPATVPAPVGLQDGHEAIVRALEAVTKWGSPFLTTFDERTGTEIVLDQGDLSFDEYDKSIVQAIPLGSRLPITIRAVDRAGTAFAGDMLKQIHLSLVALQALPGTEPPLYQASVADLAPGGKSAIVVLKQDDDTAAPLRYSLRKSDLDKAGIPAVPGAVLRVKLALRRSDGAGKRVTRSLKHLKKLPKGFVGKFDDLLAWDNARREVSVGPLMPFVLLQQLLSLGHTEPWRATIRGLWRESNTMSASPVPADEEERTSHIALFEERYPPGSSVSGTINNVRDDLGLFVTLADGSSCLAHKSKIGPEGVDQPSLYFAVGQEVDATIDAIAQDRGIPKVQLALRDAAIPSRLEQLALQFPSGSRVSGTVNNVVDDLGVFVTLDGGPSALAHKNNVGPEGTDRPSRYFTPGQAVEVTVEDLVVARQQIRIQISLRDASVPSRAEQERIRQAEEQAELEDQRMALETRFPIGAPVRGTVANVVDRLGLFVTLADGVVALAHKDTVGPEGVERPTQYFYPGMEVDVTVLAIVVDKGMPKVQLAMRDAAIPSRAEQRQAEFAARYPVGRTVRGAINNVRDDLGLFVTLADGSSCLAHKSKIGPEGVEQPSRYFASGQDVDVTVIEVTADGRGGWRIQLAMHDAVVPSRVEQLQAIYPQGAEVRGVVDGVNDRIGVFVKLDGGHNGLAHKSKIGPEGVDQPSLYFQRGQFVDAVVLAVGIDRAQPRIQLSLAGAGIPLRVDQLKTQFYPGRRLNGVVNNVLDHLGVFVTLEGEHSVLAHKSKIGPSGISKPSDRFWVGQAVDVTVIGEVYFDSRGRVIVPIAIPNLPT